jgi:hypothetical protein
VSSAPIPALSQAESIFKALIFDPIFAAVQGWLIVELPWLKLPVISSVEGDALNYIRDYLFALLVLVIDIESIQLLNDAHQAAYEAASVQLMEIAQTSGQSSAAYQKALVDAQAALSAFVHFNG